MEAIVCQHSRHGNISLVRIVFTIKDLMKYTVCDYKYIFVDSSPQQGITKKRNKKSDLASFGQWYSFSPPGQKHPKPPKQYVQAMKKGRFLDPSPPPYIEWKTDDEGRRVPWWKTYKVLSLHIHGKNLERFRSVDPIDP